MNYILLNTLIVLEIISMVYLICTIYKNNQREKAFWKKQEEISEEFIKQLQEQSITSLDNTIEGDVMVEPETTDKE